jgi:hypothetical protein
VRGDNFERSLELEKLDRDGPESERPWENGSLAVRAAEMRACGQVVAVRRCTCCGHDRAGSGSFSSVQRTCKARTCPYCSYVRGLKLADTFERALAEIEQVDGYEWQLVTQTFRYDVDRDSEDMGWRGLRRRVLLAIKVAALQWRRLLKAPGAAMYRVVEVSPRGAVHTHLVYYGPRVDQGAMQKLAEKASPERGGYVLKRGIGPDEFEPENEAQLVALKRALRSVAIYGLKGMKAGNAHHPHRNEDWMAGQKFGDGIDPKLAARWEAATFGLKLSQPYGKLMGLAPADGDDLYAYEEPDDHDVACPDCGTVGEWTTRTREAGGWFTYCHYKKGQAALEGGRWTPPWLRRKRKGRRRESVVRDF